MRDREDRLVRLCTAARSAGVPVVTIPVGDLQDLLRENASLRTRLAARDGQQPPTVLG